jgi:hypothetical protein
MPIDEATYEQLERWLRGELNAEEQTAFELKLAEDPELLAEAEWFGNAQESLRDEGRAAMKKLIAGVGAGVSVASLAAYTPSRNVIPKWKAWLKKFWWIPVSVIAAGSLVAFLTTANEIMHDKQFESAPTTNEKPNDSALTDTAPAANDTAEYNKASATPPKNETNGDSEMDSVVTKKKTQQQIFVEDRYQAVVAMLIRDSGYGGPEIMKALKRRKIEVFNSPPKPAEPKK